MKDKTSDELDTYLCCSDHNDKQAILSLIEREVNEAERRGSESAIVKLSAWAVDNDETRAGKYVKFHYKAWNDIREQLSQSTNNDKDK